MQAVDKRKLERAAKQKLEIAAKLISGGTPEWLMRGLTRVRDMEVAVLLRGKPFLPTKAQVATDLKKMIKACDPLIKKLGRHSEAGIFVAGGLFAPEYQRDTDLATRLEEWEPRAAKRLAQLQRPGRRSLLDPYLDRTPRLVCVVAVALAWNEVHGRRPSASNSKVNKAAQAMWESAGGKSARYKYVTSGHTGWRRFFEELMPKGEPSPEFERISQQIFYTLLKDKFMQDSFERTLSE